MYYIVLWYVINLEGELQLIVKSLRINNQIRVANVRVVGEKGEQLGVMPTLQAWKLPARQW